MADLNDLFKVLSEGKKAAIDSNPGKKRLQELSKTLKSELVSPTPTAPSNVPILEESVEIQEAKIPKVQQIHKQAEIEKALRVDATFQQPNPDPVALDPKAVQTKLKFLEQAIGKIAATGPGSGEVNFRYLDDVNRSTMTPSNDNWLLEYDATTKKTQFTNNIGPISSIKLDTTGPDIAPVTGMLNWNTGDDCLDVVQSGGTTCQVGLENYSQVYNDTNQMMPAGTFVVYKGVYENHITRMAVEPYTADGSKRVLLTIGVITEDIPPMNIGRVTKLGRVNDIDTTGALTNIRPTAPNSVVFVGLVLRVHPTEGSITVRYNPYNRMRYASFYCKLVQTTIPNTPTEVCFSQTLVSDGFILDGDNPLGYNEVVALRRGLYIFNYSIQFTSTNSSTSTLWVWLRKNGVDVPFSTSSWTISANGGRLVASRSFYFTLLEEDYVSVMWTSNSTNVRIDNPTDVAFAPETPAVIIDIHQINL